MFGGTITCACGWEEFASRYRTLINLWEGHLARGECPFYNASKGIKGVTKNLFDEMEEDDMTKRTMTGSTEDSVAPILGAKYWKKGTQIQGTVTSKFATQNGPAYNIRLSKPIQVNGEILNPPQKGTVTLDKMSIGNMKGFEMAVRACGTDHLESGDIITLQCTGETGTDKGNPMVNFKIRIEREDIPPSGPSDF